MAIISLARKGVNHVASGEWFAMTRWRGDTKEEYNIINTNDVTQTIANKVIRNKMKKGYRDMAEINLSLSKLYFEVESEVESYYDRIAECD